MNFAIILPHTERSQLAYAAISNINKLVMDKETKINPVIFVEEQTRSCLIPSCGLMNLSELWGYDGMCVATTVASAHILSNTPGNIKKGFYVWDLEWLRIKNQIPYTELLHIYNNNKFKIIPRCLNHKLILENNFQSHTTDIIEHCNIKELVRVLND